MNTEILLRDRFPGDVSVITQFQGDRYVTMVGVEDGEFEVVDQYSRDSSAAVAGHASIVRATRVLEA